MRSVGEVRWGAHLTYLGLEPCRLTSVTYGQCDGYLPSRRTSQSRDWYQIMLLSDRANPCLNNLRQRNGRESNSRPLKSQVDDLTIPTRSSTIHESDRILVPHIFYRSFRNYIAKYAVITVTRQRGLQWPAMCALSCRRHKRPLSAAGAVNVLCNCVVTVAPTVVPCTH